MLFKSANMKTPASSFGEFLSAKPLKAAHRDYLIRINISRNTLIAILISLLLHAALLFFVPKITFDTPLKQKSSPLYINLVAPEITAPAPVAEQAPVEPPKATIKKPVAKTPPSKIIAHQAEQTVIKTEKPSFVVPEETVKPQPEHKPKPTPATEPIVKEISPEDFPDMQSYVKAVQAQRQGVEFEAARQNAEAIAREKGPTEEQVRNERIKRNFQNGTNGIFEITSLGSRNATFAFRGWINDFSTSKRQFYQVEAKPGQDVRLQMIKRMIALIREHYQGDFNWESHRLGRSVVQSARLQDNAGLEDFLMMEFFGTNYKNDL